jgi:hypothetical protein
LSSPRSELDPQTLRNHPHLALPSYVFGRAISFRFVIEGIKAEEQNGDKSKPKELLPLLLHSLFKKKIAQ